MAYGQFGDPERYKAEHGHHERNPCALADDSRRKPQAFAEVGDYLYVAFARHQGRQHLSVHASTEGCHQALSQFARRYGAEPLDLEYHRIAPMMVEE